MEKLPLFLVFVVTMCLIVNSHSQTASKLSTLYCLNMTLKIKGQNVSGTEGTPTIYHLLRTNLYKDNGTSAKYSIEAVATGKLLCMNSKGNLYTVNSDSVQKPRRGRRRIRSRLSKKAKVSLPPRNCLFKDIEFSSRSTYRPAVGIYSTRHSNNRVGRFLAFSPDGKIHGVRKHFHKLEDDLEDNEWIKISKLPVLEHVEEYLRKTSFSKKKKFNTKVRKCIRNLADTFAHLKARHCENCLNLRKVVPTCLRRFRKKMQERTGKQDPKIQKRPNLLLELNDEINEIKDSLIGKTLKKKRPRMHSNSEDSVSHPTMSISAEQEPFKPLSFNLNI